MYCQKCGKLITDDNSVTVNFCPFCGGQQEPSQSPTPVVQTSTQPATQTSVIDDQYTHTVDISGKSVMNVYDILAPIVEAEFAKKGVTSETVVLNGAIRDVKKKKRDRTIVFIIWSVFICLFTFAGGVPGIIMCLIGMGINTALYVSKMKKIKLNNMVYIITQASGMRGNVPIGQIVAEEMARI